MNINTYPSTHDVIPKLCRPGSRKSRNDGEHLRTASCGDNVWWEPVFCVGIISKVDFFGKGEVPSLKHETFWWGVNFPKFGVAFPIICISFLTPWFQTVCSKVKVEISGGPWHGGLPKILQLSSIYMKVCYTFPLNITRKVSSFSNPSWCLEFRNNSIRGTYFAHGHVLTARQRDTCELGKYQHHAVKWWWCFW